MRIRILPISLLLFAACSGPDEDAMRAEFLRTHPGVRIESLAPGEGDADHVYYHIRYVLPTESMPREEVWGYHRHDGRPWHLFHPDSLADAHDRR